MKIEPEKQFPHSLPVVKSLARRFGIHTVSYREASAGIENTTLIVDATGGPYVFRISRLGKKSNSQIKVMEYLRSNGIPVPEVIDNKQHGPITVFSLAGNNWQVIAMVFASGSHIPKPSNHLMADMASTQARMHVLAAAYPVSDDSVRVIGELVETEFINQIDQSGFNEQLRGFLQRGASYRLGLDNNLPTGPCHLDYNEQNILCQNDRVIAVFDFDDLAITAYVVCLAYTLWDMHDQLGEQGLQTYARFYEQTRPLTAQERQVLFPAILFRHYMISAIKILTGQSSDHDTENYLRTEHYLASSHI